MSPDATKEARTGHDCEATERDEVASVASFTCPIHPSAADLSVDIGNVPFLPRSALACWWSIVHLIRVASPCYLWTFTSAQVVPDEWFANMHRNLVRVISDYARRQTKSSDGGTIPKNWGGVRIFEDHPLGHGIHSHWVMRGYMDWSLMQRAALSVGLGKIVHVDPRPVSIKAAYYLACYLTKNSKLRGCRQWANIGTYDGVGKRDIVQSSVRIDKIKVWQNYYRMLGKHRFLAYKLAVAAVDDGLILPTKPEDNPF